LDIKLLILVFKLHSFSAEESSTYGYEIKYLKGLQWILTCKEKCSMSKRSYF